jgi:hypothetical protein
MTRLLPGKNIGVFAFRGKPPCSNYVPPVMEALNTQSTGSMTFLGDRSSGEPTMKPGTMQGSQKESTCLF